MISCAALLFTLGSRILRRQTLPTATVHSDYLQASYAEERRAGADHEHRNCVFLYNASNGTWTPVEMIVGLAGVSASGTG